MTTVPITARRPFHHERRFVLTRPYRVKKTSSAVSSLNVVIHVSTDYILRQKATSFPGFSLTCPYGAREWERKLGNEVEKFVPSVIRATRVSGGGARAA